MNFWTTERLTELARMANELRLSTKEMSVYFGRSPEAISQALHINRIYTTEELHRRHGDRGRLHREAVNADVVASLGRHESDPEMGYCLGALMGDGSISNGVSYICVRDAAFAGEFRKSLDHVSEGRAKQRAFYRHQISFIGAHKVVSDGMWHWVGNCNKVASEFFLKRINADFVLSKSAEFISSFLRGSFDSDGCVPRRELNPARWAVEVSVVEATESSLIERCLARLGIGFRTYQMKPQHGCRPMFRTIIRAHKEVLRFSELVGFRTSHRRDRLAQMVSVISKGGDLR